MSASRTRRFVAARVGLVVVSFVVRCGGSDSAVSPPDDVPLDLGTPPEDDVGGKPEDHDTLLLAVRGAWFFLAW